MGMKEEFCELAGIDSASGKERAIADALRKKLETLGFSVEEDEAGASFGGDTGNLIAVLEGTLPGSILLASHMDRVPNGLGIRPIERDGRFCTDGSTILAADDVAGICAILDGVRRTLASAKPRPRIEVVFTVCEEKGMEGGKFLDLARLQSKLCYVMDSPGPIGRVVNSAAACVSLDVEVYGRAAHAGNEPERGVNAAHILCHILATLKDGRLDFETVSNFPVISTNCAVRNVVCSLAKAQGEARSRSAEKLERYVTYFERHCREAAEGTGAVVKTAAAPCFPALYAPADAPVVKIAAKALEKMGVPMQLSAGGGGMDGNFFQQKGVACVGIATGYTKNHTTAETLELASFLRAGELVQKLIETCAEEGEA